MGFYLGTFATWLRQAMALSDDVEILSDRAAIPKDRKRRPTTRWDHLAKQQSFSMPKVPSRGRLGDVIEEETLTEETAKERCSSPTRMMKQASLSYPPRSQTARPGLGAKQSSLSSLPSRHPRTLNSRTEVEQMKMPRLVKQKSSRRISDENKLTGDRRGMKKQDSFSLPNYSKRLSRREPNYRPKLPIRTQDSDSDETSDNSSSIPRLVKQRSFTVTRHLSRSPLIGNAEKGANGTCKKKMAKRDSLTMPKRPTWTSDSDEVLHENTDTLSSMPRLVKQMSFTVARHSSRTPLIGGDGKKGNVISPDSWSSPRRPTRTFDSEDGPAERTDTLSIKPRLAKQGSFTTPILSSETLELEDESDDDSYAQPNSDATPEQWGNDESDDDSNAQPNSDAAPESSPPNFGLMHESRSTSDLQPSSDATPEYSLHNSAKIHESKSTSDLLPQDISTVHELKSTSDLLPQDLSTSDVDVVIETMLSSASNSSSELPARQHLRLPGHIKAVDYTTESAEWTHHQREHLYTA